jgi:hypothetical protein
LQHQAPGAHVDDDCRVHEWPPESV